jgi:hypothetical protein
MRFSYRIISVSDVNSLIVIDVNHWCPVTIRFFKKHLLIWNFMFRRINRGTGTLQLIAHVIQGEIISLDTQISINVRNYGFEHKLSQVDDIIYAITIRHSASLWTCLFPSYALLICSQELLIRYTDELTTHPIYRAIVII